MLLNLIIIIVIPRLKSEHSFKDGTTAAPLKVTAVLDWETYGKTQLFQWCLCFGYPTMMDP